MSASTDLKSTTRLIVLIPPELAFSPHLAQAVYRMAAPEKLAVLYLVLIGDGVDTLAVSRSMATLRAMTAADGLSVDVKQAHTGIWLNTLHEIYAPGDVILCPQQPMNGSATFNAVTLQSELSGQLNAPIIPIPDLANAQERHMNPLPEFLILLGYLAVIAIFTWLEIRLDLILDGPVQKLVMISAFTLELASIWAWSWFDRRRNW